MDHRSAQVEAGAKLVSETGQALQRIVSRVNEISTLVSDIATGAEQQSIGLGQINVAIQQMDQSTQQNAAMVEESTAAVHELAKEAEAMRALMARFSLSKAPAGHRSPNVMRSHQQIFARSPEQARSSSVRRSPTPRLRNVVNGKDDWREF